MLQNVKNTTLNWLFNLLMPHYCYSCGEIGGLLCTECKYNITSQPIIDSLEIHPKLPAPEILDKVLIAGPRGGILEEIINGYKFKRNQAAAPLLAEIMHNLLPAEVSGRSKIVPIPTIGRHIRQRGYDHMYLIAQELARLARLSVAPVLTRQTSHVQHRSARPDRYKQASAAFTARSSVIDSSSTYILLDDVVTTGSTALFAAKALLNAGARQVWLLALAKQQFKN